MVGASPSYGEKRRRHLLDKLQALEKEVGPSSKKVCERTRTLEPGLDRFGNTDLQNGREVVLPHHASARAAFVLEPLSENSAGFGFAGTDEECSRVASTFSVLIALPQKTLRRDFTVHSRPVPPSTWLNLGFRGCLSHCRGTAGFEGLCF